MKYFIILSALILQLFFIVHANAGENSKMVLLNKTQLSNIEARGIDRSLKVNISASRIILWDEQLSQTSQTVNTQMQINGNGNYANTINNNGFLTNMGN